MLSQYRSPGCCLQALFIKKVCLVNKKGMGNKPIPFDFIE